MYRIELAFTRFDDVTLNRLLGAIGVYVIWDARARARPTYIGEGLLLKRFAQHVVRDGRRFAKPWDGYVAVMHGSTPGVHKDEARAGERILLDIAAQTDRAPKVNRHPGAATVVRGFCRDEPLCFIIRGYDPLLPPWQARRLPRPKVAKVCPTEEGGYVVDCQWRLRRVRAPIF